MQAETLLDMVAIMKVMNTIMKVHMVHMHMVGIMKEGTKVIMVVMKEIMVVNM